MEVKSDSELARRLGVQRGTLANWKQREGAPANRDVEAWLAFVEQNQLGLSGPKLGQLSKELKDDKLRHEIELLKARLAREQRAVIPAAEVNTLLLHVATSSRTLLYQFMETEAAPKLAGMDAAQMRPMLREMADTICEKMGDLIKDFEQQ
jgi:transcriptional regulator with XRE-family HTH domain